MVVLASVLPVPITFYRKDELPKNLIEQVEVEEEDANKDDIKELF